MALLWALAALGGVARAQYGAGANPLAPGLLDLGAANSYPPGTNGFYVTNYGAQCNGVANDWPATLLAAQAACPLGACTGPIVIPAGCNLLWSSTATGAPFALTTATLGSDGGCVTGLGITGSNGRQDYAYNQNNGSSSITIHDPNASTGLDITGNGEWVINGVDIHNATGDSAGPKTILAAGKTTTCDSDVGFIINSNLTSWAGTGTFVLFDYGAENLTVLASEISAHGPNIGVTASGDAIDISSLNTAGIVTSTTLKATPVSNKDFQILGENSVVSVNGTAANSATAILYDEGQSGANTIAQEEFDNYFRLTGIDDIGFGDGFTGTPSNSNEYRAIHINSSFELTNAGTGSPLRTNEQVMALGNRLNAPEIYAEVDETAQSSAALIQDTQSIIGGRVYGIGPNAGTCISTGSGLGTHFLTTTGCGTTVTSNDAASIETNNSDPLLRAGSLTMSGLIGQNSITFSSLPATCSVGQETYCSNCKSVADGVTMASTCVNSGAGSIAVCKGSNTWTCGQ